MTELRERPAIAGLGRRRRGRRHENRSALPARILLRLAPLLLPLALLFAGGLSFTVLQSLGVISAVAVPRGLHAFRILFERTDFLTSFVYTLAVAAVSATLAVTAGVALALFVWRLPPAMRPAAVVYKIPLILPHVAVAFIISVLLSQAGLLSSIAYHLGLTDSLGQFPALLHGSDGIGIIVAYTYKEAPFVALLTVALLDRLDPRLLQTASLLGASPLRIFVRVVLPSVLPAIHTAFLILFLYTLGGFDIPYVLGASRPQMVSMFVYERFFRMTLADQPVAMAALVVLFLFSVAFVVGYSRLARALTPWERIRE